MQQLISQVEDFSIIKHNDKKWIKLKVNSQGVKNIRTAIVGETYLEIPNETLVEVVATPEELAKQYLILNK
jgi:hypothetical protein